MKYVFLVLTLGISCWLAAQSIALAESGQPAPQESAAPKPPQDQNQTGAPSEAPATQQQVTPPAAPEKRPAPPAQSPPSGQQSNASITAPPKPEDVQALLQKIYMAAFRVNDILSLLQPQSW